MHQTKIMNNPEHFEALADKIKAKSISPERKIFNIIPPTPRENIVAASPSGNYASDYINDLEHYAKNAQNSEIKSDKRDQIVIFRMEDDYYAFYGRNIKEILQNEKIFFVPGVPSTILGVINVRGDVESVIDLGGILGLAPCHNSQGNRILVAHSGEYQCGLLVEALSDVVEILSDNIREVSGTLQKSFKDFVMGEFVFNEHLVFILDLDRIIERVII